MLELRHIYWNTPDGTPVLKNVNLKIGNSGLTAVTGPNGGGKTTLAKIIAGIERPLKGEIFFDGEDITGLDVTERAKRGISYAFQTPVRFKGLTVADLLELASGKKLSESELCALLSRVGLCARDYQGREVNASLSGGEIKRIEIATVLARRSRLSVFDEPEAGIDLWSFAGLIDSFEELKASGTGAQLIISHQERILEVADRIIVVEGGAVKEDGSREDVLPHLLSIPSCPQCPMPRPIGDPLATSTPKPASKEDVR